ncbi:MAG TPA: hypothetical protein VN656_00875 [Stellaceae bacterium]|jgi:hypothetical protein|nr:hypothetical protein [Stellaceae bacterium]
MKASLLGITLALGLASGVVAAQAADTSSTQQVAAQPQSATSMTTTEQDSFQAFKANINPTFVVPTTGGYYDQEDQYVGPHGYPLTGWREIGNPPS